MPGTWKSVIATARIPFLTLTPACMSVGLATALAGEQPVQPLDAMIALGGGLAAHVAVNMLNEYHDFRSGLDSMTDRTPFSGGSGALPADPGAAPAVLASAVVAFSLACLAGLHFLSDRGMALLPLGIAGLILVSAYTPWITRHPLASLLAPGLGFGPLMVVGTHIALTGHATAAAWTASAVPFFLVNGLLLLNQFPDVEADRSVGRRNVPLLLGRPLAARVYVSLLASAYGAIVIAVALNALPITCLLGLLTAPLAYQAARTSLRCANDMDCLMSALGRNVIVNLATPPLLAAGVFW
ncbi:MAG: prenyltransferase [Betaproteobacteria bacterium]|nr:prenyltransferase [Betaproteobacteria bacterium]